MLLYGIYTPSEHHNNSWNRARVYAFASVERLVMATREVAGAGTGTLELVTKTEADRASSIATIYTGIDENGVPKKDGESIMVHGDGVRDSWDGKVIEIKLVQTIAEEKIPSVTIYP